MAMVGLFGVAAGLNGYLLGKINPLFRIILVVAGVMFMIPLSAGMPFEVILSNVIGAAIIAAIMLLQKVINRNKPAPAQDAEQSASDSDQE